VEKMKLYLFKKRWRHAIFGVVYSVKNKKVEYLILKRKKHWKGWEFVKGKIELFETRRIALRREVKEETGQKILRVKDFYVGGIYRYKKELKDRPGIIGQTYHLFGVEVKKGKVSLDRKEHDGYKWVSFNEAEKKLTWKDQKICLKKVDDWIKRKRNF
jgi:8-oxo-dGTP pyrophosphatase MutT (NUDIX family)